MGSGFVQSGLMPTASIRIGDDVIGRGHPTHVAAEMSGNHERAYDRLRAAKEAGAQAVTLQTYAPNTISLDGAPALFPVPDRGPPVGRSWVLIRR